MHSDPKDGLATCFVHMCTKEWVFLPYPLGGGHPFDFALGPTISKAGPVSDVYVICICVIKF